MEVYILVKTIEEEKDEAFYLFYDSCGRKWIADRIMDVSKLLKRGYKETKVLGYDAYMVNL